MYRLLRLMLIGGIGVLPGCTLILCTSPSGCKVSVAVPGGTSSPVTTTANESGSTAAAVLPMSGAYRGPGDILPGATAYSGLRAYDAAYAAPGTNKAINIRRASDNATANIVILSTGSVDTATAKAFCAATICYVTEWYDQSGNGNNISQDNESQQPELTFDGYSGFPAVAFDYGRMTYLTGSFNWVSGNEAWIGQVALLSAEATNWYEPIFDYGTTATGEELYSLIHDSSSYQVSTSISDWNEISGIRTAAPAALTFYSIGSGVGGYANGVNWQQPFSSSNITGKTFVWGGSPTQVGIWLTGSIGEVILYPTSLDASAAKKLEDSERSYYGF